MIFDVKICLLEYYLYTCKSEIDEYVESSHMDFSDYKL